MSKIAEKLARRYAASLLELCEVQSLEQVRDALSAIARAIDTNSQLGLTLSDPSRKMSERKEVLGALAARVRPGDERFLNFLSLILENGRIRGIGQVANAFARAVDEVRRLLRLEIVSSAPVESGERAELERNLRGDFGELVSFTWREDPALLGGAIVRAGDRQIDGSVRGMLERVRGELSA